jgi:hypothetical protein
MWMKRKVVRVFLVLLIVGIYCTVLIRGATESSRRSLQLTDETQSTDRISVSVLVTGVNFVTRELAAQLAFRIAGAIARDEVTPAKNLKLLINNVGGEQEYDFAKGDRMRRINVVLPLSGDLNRYPFDRYDGNLRLLMVTPSENAQAEVPSPSDSQSPDFAQRESLAVGTVALRKTVPVPLSISLSASLPGVKFSGNITRDSDTYMATTELHLRRADNLISVSILINLMMSCLAISVFALALRGITDDRANNLVSLSLAITLIFGLPALRNVQPGVPPVGAFSDYVTFIWAELIVAFAAIITALHSFVPATSEKPD